MATSSSQAATADRYPGDPILNRAMLLGRSKVGGSTGRQVGIDREGRRHGRIFKRAALAGLLALAPGLSGEMLRAVVGCLGCGLGVRAGRVSQRHRTPVRFPPVGPAAAPRAMLKALRLTGAQFSCQNAQQRHYRAVCPSLRRKCLFHKITETTSTDLFVSLQFCIDLYTGNIQSTYGVLSVLLAPNIVLDPPRFASRPNEGR